jgi:hypothetical protein
MRKIGFAERWIYLIITCMRIVSYSVPVNSKPHELITPFKRLRQGDPLSHIFLLCVRKG